MTVYLHNFIRSYTLYAWSYKELLAVNKHVKPLILYVISPLLLVVLLILFSLLLLQLQEFWNTHRKREQNWTVYHPRNIVGVITQRRLINHAQDMASLWNITEQKNGSLYVCLSINILFSSFCLSTKHFIFPPYILCLDTVHITQELFWSLAGFQLLLCHLYEIWKH